MGRCPFGLLIILISLSACASGRRLSSGAELLQDATLVATTIVPTRELSPTASLFVIPITTEDLLPIVTIQAKITLVTPTLPPSATPTATPTVTNTPTITPLPTFTIPPTVTFPYSVVTATPAFTISQTQKCAGTWFFQQPHPSTCPLNPAVTSTGSFQHFQRGNMIWLEQQRAIYVLYDSPEVPRWEVFRDTFQQGMPEEDPAFNNAPSYTWQPRRGFGLVWRKHPEIQGRIGWAAEKSEALYTVQIQTGADGTLFISDPRNGIYNLAADRSSWAWNPG